MRAIAKRELKAYFYSPVGYVVVGVLLLLYGFYFYQVMRVGMSSLIPTVYGTMFIWSMIFLPILTMRSFSEEQRAKTDQALLTAPVSVGGIVMGKFLGAFVVYALVIAGSLLPCVFMEFYGSPSWPVIFGNAAAALLYGAAMISIGIFLSSLTQSQIIAAITSFGAAVMLLVIDQLTSIVNDAAVIRVLNWLSFNARYQPFTTGTFDFSGIVFFVSISGLFLFFTARRLESRRWR